MVTSPCKLGLEATIKMGVSKDGMIKAIQMTYLVNTGAYADIGPRLTRAIAMDCTGPYHIETSGATRSAYIQTTRIPLHSEDLDMPLIHFVWSG